MITFSLLAFFSVAFPIDRVDPISTVDDEPVVSSSSDEAIEDDSVFVRYDLRPVMPSFDGVSWKAPLVSALANPWDNLGGVNASELYEFAPPETILDVITRILGDEMHFEGREILLDGEASLLVLAPPAVQKKIRVVLDGLETALSSSVKIRVDVYTVLQSAGDALVESNVVTTQKADGIAADLAAAGAAHARHTFELSPGRTAILDQTRTVTFLYDFDVEIAQGAIAFDPAVLDLDEGTRIMMRGYQTQTGTVLSLWAFATDFVQGVQERRFGGGGAIGHVRDGGLELIAGPQKVQTADVATTSVACTTFLPEGKAIVLASESNRAGRIARQVMILRRVGAAPKSFYKFAIPDSNITLMLANSQPFGAARFGLDLSFSWFDGLRGHPVVKAGLEPASSQFLFDWLKPRFAVWRRFGPWAVVVTTPAWDNQAGAQLEQLIGSVDAANETVDVSVDLIASGGIGAARWSLPVMTGSAFGIVLGSTSTAMLDYNVEVAQYATVADATMVPTFDGLAGVFGVWRGTGGYVVDAEGFGHRVVLPITTIDTGPFSGRLDQIQIDTLRFNERRSVAEGATLDVGSGPGLSLRVGLR